MAEEKHTVEMTAEEMEAFKAYQEKKREEEAEAKKKADREAYAQLVDEAVGSSAEKLAWLSGEMARVKREVYASFGDILKMKGDILNIQMDGQRTHTFTDSESANRIVLGYNCIDGYRDTVEDGILLVKNYIESLAIDDKTKALVNAVMRLLSRDNFGNLKASRVLQLRKMADESGDKRFKEGVQIIEEAYQPTITKQFIRAERRDEKGAWRSIPLSVTDCDMETARTTEEQVYDECRKKGFGQNGGQ